MSRQLPGRLLITMRAQVALKEEVKNQVGNFWMHGFLGRQQ